MSWVPDDGHFHGAGGFGASGAEEFLGVAAGCRELGRVAAVPGVLAGGWALEFPDLPNLPAAPGGRAGPDSASLLHSSGGYRHLAGALLPPVPAALRWDADV